MDCDWPRAMWKPPSLVFLVGLAACAPTAAPDSPPDAAAAASAIDLAALRAEQPARVARALAAARAAAGRLHLVAAPEHAATDATGTTAIRFAATYAGLPLRGRWVAATVHADGSIGVAGHPDDDAALAAITDTTPTIDEATALATARAALARAARTPLSLRATLMLDPEQRSLLIPDPARPGQFMGRTSELTGYTLRWVVDARVADPALREVPWTLTVDARTGELRDEGPGTHFARAVGTLKGYYDGVQSLDTEAQGAGADGRYLLQDPHTTMVRAILDQDNHVVRLEPFVHSFRTNIWGDGQLPGTGSNPKTAHPETQAADAYVGARATFLMLDELFGHDGWDGQGGTVTIATNVPVENSIWSGGGTISLGYANWTHRGFDQVLRSYASIDVVGHEIGHGVFESQSGVATTAGGELGGLEEGTGDIIGVLADFGAATANNPGHIDTAFHDLPPPNWEIADLEGTPRSLMDPAFPEWTPDTDTLKAHEAAGVLDRMFYFLVVGALPPGATAPVPGPMVRQRSSKYLPDGMTGIGLASAGRIWYRALANLTTTAPKTGTPTMHSARDAALQAVIDLDPVNGYCSTHYQAVADAFAAVHVGVPADREGPKVDLQSVQLSATKVRLTVHVTDPSGVSSALVDIGSTAVFCAEGCTVDLDTRMFPDGRNTALVTATDACHNHTAQSFDVAIDNQPPTATLSDRSAPGDNLRHFVVSADDTSGIQVIVLTVPGVLPQQSFPGNAHGVNAAFDVDVTSLGHGHYPVEATVSDRWGYTRHQTIDLFVDRKPPALCNIQASQIANSTSVAWAINANDPDSNMSRVTVTLDGDVLYKWPDDDDSPSPRVDYYSSVGLVTGQHEFRAWCTDVWHNTSQDYHPVRVSDPPRVTLSPSQPRPGVVRGDLTAYDPRGLQSAWIDVSCGFQERANNATYPSLPSSATLGAELENVPDQTKCIITAHAKNLDGAEGSVEKELTTPKITQSCGRLFEANGADDPKTYFVDVGKSDGTFDLRYHTYQVPDQINVSCADGGTVAGAPSQTTGCVGTGTAWLTARYSFSCSSKRLRFDVAPNCSGTDETLWQLIATCAW
jgi:Zn-dependent metalloprotease